MKIIKRSGSEDIFDAAKIVAAIRKANDSVLDYELSLIHIYKELADAFVDKVQVFEDGRISVNLVYDDCLEELLQVHCTAMNCNCLLYTSRCV